MSDGSPALRITLPSWVDDLVGWPRRLSDDDASMRLAIELARENVRREMGGPFGALVVERETGTLVAAGVNSVLRLGNSMLHAEVVALMMAQRERRSFTLAIPGGPGYDLFSSCEPCAMCLGAILWSGVRRVVWGALREDAARLAFDEGPVFPESHHYLRARGIELVPGYLRHEAQEPLELYRAGGGTIYNG